MTPEESNGLMILVLLVGNVTLFAVIVNAIQDRRWRKRQTLKAEA